MLLSEKRVYIKQLSIEHIPDYLDVFSSRIQTILGVSSVWSEYEYVHSQLKKQTEKKTWFYGIFICVSNVLIGSIEIRSPEHRGQLYTWLHEQYWGKGLFQEAFFLAKEDYFKKNMSSDFFTAHVDASNQTSYKALCTAGCIVHGIIHGPREKQYYFKCFR